MANILIGGVNLKTLGMHQGRAIATAYGAKANDTYDNTGVVQAIIDAWEALDGGTIVFPATQEGERYRFTGPVINDGRGVVCFSGTGKSSTGYVESGPMSNLWLDSTTANACLIKYATTSAAVGGQIVERLHFQGNTPFASAGLNQSAIVFAGSANENRIRDCGFQYFTGYAIAHDPTVVATYQQGGSLRDSHFWNVAGCFGPVAEYAGTNYLFATLYTIDNVGLDHGLYTGALKPYIWDFRATRTVAVTGNFLIEGVGTAGMTAAVALASGGVSIDQIHYEITTNDPQYLFALYGSSVGGLFNSTAEGILKIGSVGIDLGVPIWFENAANNEWVIEIGNTGNYDADAITDLFEWEDGIENNASGKVTIDTLQSKNAFVITDNYKGRIIVNTRSGMDHAARSSIPDTSRLLMRWNAGMGSIIGEWGEVFVNDAGSATLLTVDSHAIEADGNYLCQRFTANSTYFFPALRVTVRGDNFEGANVIVAMRYRCTINAADSGVTPGFYQIGAHFTESDVIGQTDKNLTTYSMAIMHGMIAASISDPERWVQWTPVGGTPTVPVVLRLLAVEVWLGAPPTLECAPALVPQVPTFGAADATPSVTGHKTWKTGTSGLTITDLDDFPAGEERTIISKGAIVFDVSGNLDGSTVNLTTASGDVTKWVSEDGTTKRLVGFVKAAIDNSGGA